MTRIFMISNRPKTQIGLILVLMVGCGLLVAVTRSRSAVASIEKTPLAAPFSQRPERFETELITIRPQGFEPAQITRPPGRFVLSIHDRSGSDQLELRFEREHGSRVNALQGRKRKFSWADEVDLPPGRYVLLEASHPEWRCLITITAR
jgi:hypothetical protein